MDETGTVFVRTADGERPVGQYPDGTPEEALAYFERKYVELAGQVTLLEQRIKRGTAAHDIAKTVATMRSTVAEANAVGDLGALEKRLEALIGAADEFTEQQKAESKAALELALAERAAIVTDIEALAAQDFSKAQWKHVSAGLDALFERWKKHQQEGPRLPKGDSAELWKRFRAARTTIEAHRKAFFTELDSVHKDSRMRKQELIERAEALAAKGVDGIPAYRALLDEWKRAGRAGKKADDALWAKFTAAGDVLYAAKAELDAIEDVAHTENLEKKLALLEEAEKLLTVTDVTVAKETLLGIQRRWDEVGKVPRDKVRTVEDRMRKVEAAVRKLDEQHWQRNDPEKKARSEGLTSQLEAAIAKLESELEDAKASKDAAKIAEAQEALDARKAWLAAIG